MQQRASVWFVFTVVLIDMIGFGLVMPVLPGLIMELGRMSIDRAAISAGWLAAGEAIAQFPAMPLVAAACFAVMAAALALAEIHRARPLPSA